MGHDVEPRSKLNGSAWAIDPGATTSWRYAPTNRLDAVEFGFWKGPGSRSLRPHFHDETQITMVLAGCRAFRIDDAMVTVKSGHGIVIPAGLLHAPVAVPGIETSCINLYVEGDRESHGFDVFAIRHPALLVGAILPDALSKLMQDIPPRRQQRTLLETDRGGLRAALTGGTRRIGQIAADFELSREGFSRRVRRELNIAPHGFRVVSRLNHARRLLREGKPIATVAVEAGFSDQSHLTRLFRETFGITPGLYKRADA